MSETRRIAPFLCSGDGERWADHLSCIDQPHSEASAEVSTDWRFANRRVEHGPFPHTEFGFPENEARGRRNCVEAVLPALVHPGWFDHSWGGLAFPGALSRSGFIKNNPGNLLVP